MATRIGCDNLVYALMTAEDTADTAPTYGAVKAAPGVIAVKINPNPSQDTLFADDGPMDTTTTLGKVEVEINKNELTAENRSDLLGHQIDSKGGLASGADDVAPFVAVGFRTLKSNGKYRYVWLYKGKFTDPEDNNETKGDSINYQTEMIKGQFLRLNNKYTINAKSVRPWKYEIDADTPTADSALMTSWFTAVQFPTADV